MKQEYKALQAQIESKAAGEDGKLHITFYALAFGNIDSYGDVIEKGACAAFLKSDNKRRVRLCYQHERDTVIGVITSMKEDEKGLLCEADILPTSKGQDVQILLKEGAIDEFSIGYFADEFKYEKRDGYEDPVRVLTAITIVEISPVTRAANPAAVLIDAKSEDYKRALKSMSDEQLQALRKAVDDERMSRLVSGI